jgi:hypothetical protein
LAESSAPTKSGDVPHWLQIVSGVIGVVGAVIGVPAAYWLDKKTRLETIKLQLDILEKEGQLKKADTGEQQTTLSREDLIASPHAVLTGIQGFIIRFIILYVAILGWGIVDKLLNPFIQAHLSRTDTYAQLQSAFLRLSAMISQYFTAAA